MPQRETGSGGGVAVRVSVRVGTANAPIDKEKAPNQRQPPGNFNNARPALPQNRTGLHTLYSRRLRNATGSWVPTCRSACSQSSSPKTASSRSCSLVFGIRDAPRSRSCCCRRHRRDGDGHDLGGVRFGRRVGSGSRMVKAFDSARWPTHDSRA